MATGLPLRWDLTKKKLYMPPHFHRGFLKYHLLRSVLSLFRVLKLFPSIGTDVVKHYNTVGVHRSFPQGVVS